MEIGDTSALAATLSGGGKSRSELERRRAKRYGPRRGKRETPLGWTWQPRQRTARPVSAAGVAGAAGPETALASAAAAAPSTATTAVETVVARLEHSSPEAHRHIIKVGVVREFFYRYGRARHFCTECMAAFTPALEQPALPSAQFAYYSFFPATPVSYMQPGPPPTSFLPSRPPQEMQMMP